MGGRSLIILPSTRGKQFARLYSNDRKKSRNFEYSALKIAPRQRDVFLRISACPRFGLLIWLQAFLRNCSSKVEPI